MSDLPFEEEKEDKDKKQRSQTLNRTRTLSYKQEEKEDEDDATTVKQNYEEEISISSADDFLDSWDDYINELEAKKKRLKIPRELRSITIEPDEDDDQYFKAKDDKWNKKS